MSDNDDRNNNKRVIIKEESMEIDVIPSDRVTKIMKVKDNEVVLPILIIPGFMSSGLKVVSSKMKKWEEKRVWLNLKELGFQSLHRGGALMKNEESRRVSLLRGGNRLGGLGVERFIDLNDDDDDDDDDDNEDDDDDDIEQGNKKKKNNKEAKYDPTLHEDYKRQSRCKSEWVEHMSLHPDMMHERDGLKIRPIPGLAGVDYLAPGRLTDLLSYVFGPVINALVASGRYFRDENIDAAPYDWRIPPLMLEERDGYFSETMKKIDRLFVKNGERPVVVVCHSLGCKTAHYLFNFIHDHPNGGKEWMRRRIYAYVPVGGPHGGAPKAIRASVDGDKLGLDTFLSDEEGLVLGRSLGSAPWLFPAMIPVSQRCLPSVYVRHEGGLRVKILTPVNCAHLFRDRKVPPKKLCLLVCYGKHKLCTKLETVRRDVVNFVGVEFVFPAPPSLACDNNHHRLENGVMDFPLEIHLCEPGIRANKKVKKVEIQIPSIEVMDDDKALWYNQWYCCPLRYFIKLLWCLTCPLRFLIMLPYFLIKFISTFLYYLLKLFTQVALESADVVAKSSGSFTKFASSSKYYLSDILQPHDNHHHHHHPNTQPHHHRPHQKNIPVKLGAVVFHRRKTGWICCCRQESERPTCTIHVQLHYLRPVVEDYEDAIINNTVSSYSSINSEEPIQCTPIASIDTTRYTINSNKINTSTSTSTSTTTTTTIAAAAKTTTTTTKTTTAATTTTTSTTTTTTAASLMIPNPSSSLSKTLNYQPKHKTKSHIPYHPIDGKTLLHSEGLHRHLTLLRDIYDTDPYGPRTRSALSRPPSGIHKVVGIYGINLPTEVGAVYRRKSVLMDETGGRGDDGLGRNVYKYFEVDLGVRTNLVERLTTTTTNNNNEGSSSTTVVRGYQVNGGIIRETKETPQVVIPQNSIWDDNNDDDNEHDDVVRPNIQNTSGDGTVPYWSLQIPKTWNKPGVCDVRIEELEGAEHREILADKRLHQLLLDVCCVHVDDLPKPEPASLAVKLY